MIKIAKRSFSNIFEKDARPIILFDGVCNFCNANVNLLLKLDKIGNYRFASI